MKANNFINTEKSVSLNEESFEYIKYMQSYGPHKKQTIQKNNHMAVTPQILRKELWFFYSALSVNVLK